MEIRCGSPEVSAGGSGAVCAAPALDAAGVTLSLLLA